MRTITGLLLLVISVAGYSQTKSITDYPGQFEIKDTSSVDSSYAPIVIQKAEVAWIAQDWQNQKRSQREDGPVGIFLNGTISKTKESSNNFSDRPINEADFVLDASDFNAFANNHALYLYLKDITAKDNAGYTKLNSIDANSNIDTVWYQVNATADTSFYYYQYFNTSTSVPDKTGFKEY